VYALGDRFGVTDAEIFMKVDATPRETAALRTTLAHDPDIASFRYISTTDAYEIFKSEFSDQPELVQGTKLGDLPQSFRLNVALGRSVEKVADRYRIDAGVDTVIQQEPMTFLKPPKGSGAPPTPCTGS
jgi:cell division protein FtsX